MKLVITVSIIICGCLFLSAPQVLPSVQQNRIALVIGNSGYDFGPLKNPTNDATDMASALKQLGFEVILKLNADQRIMEDSIRVFGKQLRQGGMGLFYFAGHGMQIKGRNYLIPIGARIETESEVKYEAVDAGRVLGQMEDAGNGLNIIILDACRNNPISRNFRNSVRGLARMDTPEGSILAYATGPGKTAYDGGGRNGLYTSKLLKHMMIPGLPIEQYFKYVRRDVRKDSGKRQVPWIESSLIGDFYFIPPDVKELDAQPAEQEAVIFPKESKTSFDDLQKASDRKRQAVEKWKQWQQDKQREFLKAKNLDSDEFLTPEQKVIVWQRFLAAISQDNPYTSDDDDMRSYSESRVSHWGSVKSQSKNQSPSTKPIISDQSQTDSPPDSKNIITSAEDLVAYGNGVVYDKNTGLEWYAGPDEGTNYLAAKRWIKNLPAEQGGWRLPTLNELRSLYQQKAGRRKLKTFSKTNDWWVWSSLTEDEGDFVYGIRLANGKVFRIYPITSKNLRAFAVRSRR